MHQLVSVVFSLKTDFVQLHSAEVPAKDEGSDEKHLRSGGHGKNADSDQLPAVQHGGLHRGFTSVFRQLLVTVRPEMGLKHPPQTQIANQLPSNNPVLAINLGLVQQKYRYGQLGLHSEGLTLHLKVRHKSFLAHEAYHKQANPVSWRILQVSLFRLVQLCQAGTESPANETQKIQ